MSDERWLGRDEGLLAGVIPLEDVIAYGRYASCEPQDGHLYEYDQGRFWVAAQGSDEQRRPVEILGELPLGPWRHAPFCDCRACRAQRVE
jgi:hypothetical protein